MERIEECYGKVNCEFETKNLISKLFGNDATILKYLPQAADNFLVSKNLTQ